MGSREYWQRRSEDIAQAQYDKADAFLEEMVSAYDRAKANITKEIEVFYARYAQNNEISYSEAVKKLTPAELKLFRMTLDEFIAKAKDNEDGRWTKELNNVYYKTRISRLDALYTQIQHHIEMITDNTVTGTSAMLSDTYEDTYYRNIHSIQTGLGFGVNFGKLDKDKVNAATTERWLGGNYSSRIWEDKDALVRGLQTTIPQALIRGEALKRTVEIALGKLQGSESNVRRIIKTEQSYLVHKATASGYAASGVVQEYEFLATLDKKTSEICRGTDKQVFNLKDLRVGVNYPPLHPNCRSTVTPYFKGNVTKRIARGVDGKTYDVPGDMNYGEWYDRYVTKQTENNLNELIGLTTTNGIKVISISKHTIDRTIERKMDIRDIQEALINPLKIGKIRIDEKGKSQRFTGAKAKVNINPDTGTLITVFPTSTKESKKLKGV